MSLSVPLFSLDKIKHLYIIWFELGNTNQDFLRVSHAVWDRVRVSQIGGGNISRHKSINAEVIPPKYWSQVFTLKNCS